MKTLIFGCHHLSNQTLSHTFQHQLEIIPLPFDYPAHSLKFLGDFNLIILNHHAPNEDSFSQIRSIRRNCETPILVIGDGLKNEQIINLFRQGASDLIQVPFSLEDVQFRIEHHLQKQNHVNKQVISKSVFPWKKGVTSSSSSTTFGLIASMFEPLTPPLLSLELEADLVVQFLGDFTLSISNKAAPSLPQRQRSLLAYFFYHQGKKISREKLIRQFWDYNNLDAGRNNLNVAIYALRQYLLKYFPQEEVILSENGNYYLNPALRIQTDIVALQQHWNEARNLENQNKTEEALQAYYRAYTYYQGDFLEDLAREEWTETERLNLQERYLVILSILCKHFQTAQKYELVKRLAKKMLDKDACLEKAHRILMETYQQTGFKEKALRQFSRCREALREELGVSPSPATMQLYESIL